MALGWLDVVRFADTVGYHSDTPRNVCPYRDWVIKSFNDNKRFDRFSVEQLAGDLLPEASVETRVGSAFNRLLLSTEEGGAQAKDYEARMLTDRVRAIGARLARASTDLTLPMSRSQVRSLYHAGFLFAGGYLRGHPGTDSRTPRRGHDRCRAGAARATCPTRHRGGRSEKEVQVPSSRNSSLRPKTVGS